jgi:hypothetical protein
MTRILVMDAAQTIRDAVSKVSELRNLCAANPQLHEAVLEIKRFQAARFSWTYADMLGGGPYQGAARFFLNELYGDRDFAQRDAQFSRISGALQKLLPKPAVVTAVLLAKLHLLTEEMDHEMGLAWLLSHGSGVLSPPALDRPMRYVQAWQKVGQIDARKRQLASVLSLGQDLERLTKTSGLRFMLKLMRRPAAAADLSDLQHFLETGFDTFAAMGRNGAVVQEFLHLVEKRELDLMDDLFARTPLEMAAVLSSLA